MDGHKNGRTDSCLTSFLLTKRQELSLVLPPHKKKEKKNLKAKQLKAASISLLPLLVFQRDPRATWIQQEGRGNK